VFVGIDQSLTNFAAVALKGSDDPEPVHLTVKPKSKGVRRLWDLREELSAWLERLGPVEHITMEAYAFRQQMGHSLGECGGMVKLALADLYGLENQNAYPSIVKIQHLKMFAGLAGNAQKNLILKAVFQKWGQDYNDDNLADAYVLAQIAASLTIGARFEYEKTVLAKIAEHTEWELPKSSPRRTTAAKRTSSG
jgi:crossover junction endodeoxyribonuclease RuvC